MLWIYAKRTDDNIRAQRAASREILRYAVDVHFGRDIETLSFSVRPNGKPFFDGDASGIRFNVSHSGNYSVCSVGDEESGIDIQLIRPIRERVCEKYLGGYTDDVIEQVRRWTRRESLGKFTGNGFHGNNDGIQHVFTEYRSVENYIITLCTAPETLPPEDVVFL